jgi:hypothetical protein
MVHRSSNGEYLIVQTGAEIKGVEWKKMGGWDGDHTLSFKIKLCELKTTLCGLE